jgi:hypothetical protein
MNAPFTASAREGVVASIVRACIEVARGASDCPSDRLADLIIHRSAVSPTSRTDAAALALVAVKFVASLTPVSAAAAVIARSVQISFDGAAQIAVPSLSLPNAAFISESAAIPVVMGVTSGGSVLLPAKLATIVSLSGEMVRNSAAEALVRQVLVENVGASLDAALFNANAAVPGTSPAGILNGITPITAAASGTPTEKMVADIGAIAQVIAQVAGSNGGAIIVAAPREAVMLSMLAEESFIWPIFMSAALPAGTVIGIAAAGLATAIDAPRIESSSEVTLHMDDAPGELVSTGGALAHPVRSAFQTDSTALRFILPATWARRSNKAVAWVQGAQW